MQLAFVYTGERIAQISDFYNLDTWQKPYSQLDFSFEWKMSKYISFYGKITNLTNSKAEYYIKQPYYFGGTIYDVPGQTDPAHSIFVQRETYKINYLAGLRFKLK